MTNLELEKEKLAKQKRLIAQKEAKLKEKLRKTRTRRLIELGGLVAKAKLDHLPSNILYGALLSCSKELFNEDEAKAQDVKNYWREIGAKAFEEESKEFTPLILTLQKEENAFIRAHLREHGLKYNRMRREWYGNVRNIEELVAPLKEQQIPYEIEIMQ